MNLVAFADVNSALGTNNTRKLFLVVGNRVLEREVDPYWGSIKGGYQYINPVKWNLEDEPPTEARKRGDENRHDSINAIKVLEMDQVRYLATLDGAGLITLHYIDYPQRQPMVFKQSMSTWSLDFDAKGGILYVGTNERCVFGMNLRNKPTQPHSIIKDGWTKIVEHSHNVPSISLSPNGRQLASVSVDSRCVISDLKNTQSRVGVSKCETLLLNGQWGWTCTWIKTDEIESILIGRGVSDEIKLSSTVGGGADFVKTPLDSAVSRLGEELEGEGVYDEDLLVWTDDDGPYDTGFLSHNDEENELLSGEFDMFGEEYIFQDRDIPIRGSSPLVHAAESTSAEATSSTGPVLARQSIFLNGCNLHSNDEGPLNEDSTIGNLVPETVRWNIDDESEYNNLLEDDGSQDDGSDTASINRRRAGNWPTSASRSVSVDENSLTRDIYDGTPLDSCNFDEGMPEHVASRTFISEGALATDIIAVTTDKDLILLDPSNLQTIVRIPRLVAKAATRAQSHGMLIYSWWLSMDRLNMSQWVSSLSTLFLASQAGCIVACHFMKSLDGKLLIRFVALPANIHEIPIAGFVVYPSLDRPSSSCAPQLEWILHITYQDGYEQRIEISKSDPSNKTRDYLSP